jgi:hypothetical protein
MKRRKHLRHSLYRGVNRDLDRVLIIILIGAVLIQAALLCFSEQSGPPRLVIRQKWEPK